MSLRVIDTGLLEVKINHAELRDLSSFYKKSYDASAKATSESIKETTAVILLKGRLNIQGSGPPRSPPPQRQPPRFTASDGPAP
jgi:hypothetical protein